MWQQWVKRWMDMVFWWIPRDRNRSEPESEGTRESEATASDSAAAPEQDAAESAEPATPAATSAAAPEAPAPSATASQDVTAVKGIGPAMQAKLAELDIRTVGDLADADADDLLAKLKPAQRTLTRDRVAGWVAAARDLR